MEGSRVRYSSSGCYARSEAMTQGAPIVDFSGRLRTQHRGEQRGLTAQSWPLVPSQLRGGRDRYAAARLLAERDANLVGPELQSMGCVVADADGERLGERAFVAERAQVELQRLGLDAERPGPELDRRDVEVRLARHGADRRQLV